MTVQASFVCRNGDFESLPVDTVEKASSVETAVSQHLEKNPTHAIEILFVWAD